MALLSIQERSRGAESSIAVVRFDNGPLHPITISNPFSDEEEQELEWYFEEHLEFPFTNKVRAQNAARSITTYGEKLFKQVFGDNDVYAEYRALLRGGLSGLQIEIEGSPTFHALHWEAIKDPKFEQPLALPAAMVRKNLQPQALPASTRPSPTINLLVVTARPSVEHDVGYRTISRPLVESLRNANLAVQVDILRPGTYKAFENHLRMTTEQRGEGYYHVVHFDVHGAVLTYEQYESVQPQAVGNSHLYKQYGRDPIQPYEGVKAFLSFEPDADEDTKKKSDLVEATQLAALLVKHQVPITILNACQSGKQVGERETSLGSHLVQSGVQLVLAMGYSVTVSATELLMTTLYQRLFAGDDLTIASRHARTELANDKERQAYSNQKIELEDWLLPVVYQNRPVTLQPREFTQDERKDWFERKAEEQRYTPPDPTYGFVGRDLDILRIEKRLLTRRNILLVRGMGGAGKTTLLRHLAAWWHTTGFVRRVFSFGYDDKAWTLQQIMAEIAQILYGPRYSTDFQPLSPAAQQAMLAQRLRSENHLLLLDNLESITGVHLAIQHTLPQAERQALRGFLTDLAKGRTLVLLGSRGSEDWLAKGTFDDNIYELPGLDRQAASILVDRIVLKNNAEKYRQHPDLKQVLKLLNGFPLALEVVLANLAHQTPSEVLAALQEGDVKLDIDDSKQEDKSIFEQKTESILRCIDYAHSNLSPEAQSLLLCLAPFTSVIFLGVFDLYTSFLKQQSTLAALPFERLEEVVGVAENWGLLRRDPNIPEFVHLQPTLPYFLRSRLSTLQQTEVRRAIETAYREHYAQYGSMLHDLLQSKDPQEQHKGRVLTQMEYENLTTAVKLALAAWTQIIMPYIALDGYLDIIHVSQRGLELGQMVLERLQDYPAELRTDFWKFEVSIVIDNMARHKLQLKDYEAAEALYYRAHSIYIEQMNGDTNEVKTMIANNYHQLGILAQRQHHWHQSGEYYQQALQMYKESGDRYAEADTHYQLSTIAGEGHQWDQVEEHCKRSLQIYGEFNDHYSQAKVLQELGDATREQHHLTEAKEYFQQALQLKIHLNDRYSQAITYYHLGIVAQQQGEWLQAEQYYQQALDIDREFNDLDSQADAYHQLARLAQEQSQWNQAEQYYQQALHIYVELNDRYKQAKTYLNLGSLAQGQQKWSHAEGYYRQALPIFTEFNDRYGESVAHMNLGAVAQEQKQWDLAKHYNQQALPILTELNDLYGQANIYSNLGWIAHEQQQLDQARGYFLHALEIFTAYEDVEAASPALFGLALLWQRSRDPNLLSDISSIFETPVEVVSGLLDFIVTNKSNK